MGIEPGRGAARLFATNVAPGRARPRERPARSIEWHLGVLCILFALPILGFVAWVLWQYTGAERERLESQSWEILHKVAPSIERYLTAQSAMTELAGYSPPLQNERLADVERASRELASALDITIILRKPDGRRLVHTGAEGAAAPLWSVRDEDAMVLKTRRPVVSGLFTDPLAGGPLVAITAPVLRPGEGGVAYLLTFAFPPDRIARTVALDLASPNLIGLILDGAGRIVASNRPAAAPVGQAIPSVSMYTSGEGGKFRAAWTNGKPMVAHYARLTGTDWVVVVGTMASTLEAPLRRFLLQLVGIGLALGLLSPALAFTFGRRITGAFGELRAAAATLGRGRPVEPVQTQVSQVNEVGAAIRAAAQEIEAGRERQILLNRELHHRVKNNLASVQAVVRASGRYASTVQDYRDALLQRIGSLSSTHDLLVAGGRAGLSLADLLKAELRPYDDGVGRISMRGPKLDVPAEIALSVGMIVHELATNAAKYGALSSPAGRLSVTWREREETGVHWLEMEWNELGVGSGDATKENGFGSMLFERLARQLGGSVSRAFSQEGLRFVLKCPLGGAAPASTHHEAAHG